MYVVAAHSHNTTRPYHSIAWHTIAHKHTRLDENTNNSFIPQSFVSVGHRPSIRVFHQRELVLYGDARSGAWTMKGIDDEAGLTSNHDCDTV